MNLKNKKKRRSMCTRLSVTYAVLIILIVIGAATAFYKFYEYNIYSDAVKNVRQQSKTTMAQVDNCLTVMEQATVDVLSDNSFMDTWMKARESGTEEDALAVRRILTKAYSNKSSVRRIAVYSRDGVYFSTGKVSVTKEEVQNRAEMIENNYNLRYFNSKAYMPPHTDFWCRDNQTSVISEIKPIKDKNTQIVGYIEVQQNLMYLQRICDLKWNGEPIDVMLFSADTNDLFYMNMAYDDKNMEYMKNVKEFTLSSLYFEESSTAIYSCAYSNVAPCRMVLVMAKSLFSDAARKIMVGILVIAGLVIIATVLYSYLTTKIIMRPINRLVHRMEQTDIDNFNEKIEGKVKDRETEILENAFQQMAERLQDSMNRQRKLETVQTKALFSALQSTMGPHFLYNSLGGIANLCERGENETAADVCYSLTEILRYASNYEESEVMIRDEIVNISDYMSIMKSRYRHRVEFELNIDEKAELISIPKLTLQPLIENAIRYSLLETETVLVKIYIIVLKNEMLIEVKDNGRGISEEKVLEIQKKIRDFKDKDRIETHTVKFGGLGLAGTLIRLTIYYGDSFRYEIQNNNDEGGTTIQLRMDISGFR